MDISLSKFVSKNLNRLLQIENEETHIQVFALIVSFIYAAVIISMVLVIPTRGWNIYYTIVYGTFSFITFSTLFFIRLKYFGFAKNLFLISIIFFTTIYLIIGGKDIGVDYNFFIYLVMATFLFENLWNKIIVFIACALGFIITQLYLEHYEPLFVEPNALMIKILVFIGCMLVLFYFTIYFLSRIRNYQKNIEQLLFEQQENNRLLEAANAELEQFTYVASHDLKTPLRNINSYIGLIERNLEAGEINTLKEYLKVVKSSSEHLYDLIEDILLVTKVNTNPDLVAEPVDLNELVASSCKNLNSFIQENNGQVMAQQLPTVNAPKNELQIVFQNLIENGIKYNQSEHPAIEISSKVDGGQLLIAFQDNGIGIEDQYKEKIFEMFKRLHTTEEYEGTGMGLAISKKIINKLGGDITIDSKAQEGSTFTLRLDPSKAVAPL